MPTPADHPHPRRSPEQRADLLEDFTFGLMIFAGVAIAVTILVLTIIL